MKCFFLCLLTTITLLNAEQPPNIAVVLCDDLGYGDLGCYGHPVIKTPRIDAFAAESLTFTQCYSAAPNCSPARTGLITGRTPWRVGIHNWIPFMSPMHVKAEEITIATLLQDAGYQTCHVGKWHLNGLFNLPGQPQPNDHGFDHWFATQNNALPNHRDPYNFVRNGIPVGPLKGYAAPLVIDEAIAWLKGKSRTEEKPFFQFICVHEPHEPIATDPKYEALYAEYPDPARRAHHGNITQMDDAFGRYLDALDDLKLTENTLVFFTSDNGPAITGMHPYGSSGPLRDKKGAIYEGGIRVPGILRWPGKTKANSRSNTPVSGVDLLPTLCELAGIEPPRDRKIDGSSFLPLLKGEPFQREVPLYWHFNRAKSPVKVAMRDGDWKITARLTGPQFNRGADLLEEEQNAQKSAELTGFELYDLGSDPAETNDLAATETGELNQIKSRLEAMYREVRDESPTWPVWEWPKYEGQRIEWPEYWTNRKRK
ncbi:MAG: sulfatase-like hydrolase/transferase [Verrucomicrobiales bacterium]|nr:sulfatase-like hydrolase/transferase [Verrucomicrobiales bacterium]